ncbi:hypothetical protein FRX31_029344, partial [Thalictrum thalictroides]
VKIVALTTPLGDDDNDVVLLGEEPPTLTTAQPVRRSPEKTIGSTTRSLGVTGKNAEKNAALSGLSTRKMNPGRPSKGNPVRDNSSFSKTPGRKASGF